MQVQVAVSRLLERLDSGSHRPTILVAFSAGPDSTALLHALAATARQSRFSVRAAHLDHAMDDGSAERARYAAHLAESIGVEIETARRSATEARRPGESQEAAARRIRYDFLLQTADAVDARFVATAHHAGDQRETVLLRLLFGSGLAGVAGIPARRGRIIRPLLDVERRDILAYLEEHGLQPALDPTNLETSTPRNAVRHLLLPALEQEDESIGDRLLSLSCAARQAVRSTDRRLVRLLSPQHLDGALSIRRSDFESLPSNLRPFAVGALCRDLGAPPPTASALADLDRQIEAGGGLGSDLGSGWRVEDRDGTLFLCQREASPRPFAYTLRVPGEIRLAEVSLVFRLHRGPVEPWMLRGSRWRAALSLPLADGDRVTVRSRRPGDRIRPFGCSYSRRLKDILIDRKMPRSQRDRLPLLCVGDRIVWVPGITIDHETRLTDESQAWVAEIVEAQESEP